MRKEMRAAYFTPTLAWVYYRRRENHDRNLNEATIFFGGGGGMGLESRSTKYEVDICL